jgi:beta-lactamase regulating signal transducer with metallopeptidase domain
MLRTILPFVAASGRVWLVVLIYKTVNDSEGSTKVDVSAPSSIKRTRGTYPTYYATTSKGFITNDLWINIIATFTELVRAEAGGKHAMLLLDRHSVHLEMASFQSLIDNCIHPYTYQHTPLILFSHWMM